MKKLYEVRVEVVVYLLAFDEEDAAATGEDAASEELRSGNEHHLKVREVLAGEAPGCGWGRGSILYGCAGSVSLGEALDALEKARRA